MALKDWKKYGDSEWYYLPNRYWYLIVWKPGLSKKERDRRGINTYGVRFNFGGIQNNEKWFKTKSQALKYAKGFMEKH